METALYTSIKRTGSFGCFLSIFYKSNIKIKTHIRSGEMFVIIILMDSVEFKSSYEITIFIFHSSFGNTSDILPPVVQCTCYDLPFSLKQKFFFLFFYKKVNTANLQGNHCLHLYHFVVKWSSV